MSEKNYMVEKAQEEDLPGILTAQRAAFQREFERTGEPNIDAIVQTLDELREDFRKMTIVVARMDGKIVGTGRAHVENGAVHINKIAVVEEARGSGIGSAIVLALEAAFPEMETFELYTSTGSPDNVRFYERLGYAGTKTRAFSNRLEFVYMEKKRPRTVSV